MTVPASMLDGKRRGTRKDGARKEVEIMRAIMQYCAARRIRVERVNTGMMTVPDPRRRQGVRRIRFEKVGSPDLRGIIKPWNAQMKWGIPIHIEVKRPKQPLTPAQAFRIQELRADGAMAFRAESIEDVARQLDTYGVPGLDGKVPECGS